MQKPARSSESGGEAAAVDVKRVFDVRLVARRRLAAMKPLLISDGRSGGPCSGQQGATRCLPCTELGVPSGLLGHQTEGECGGVWGSQTGSGCNSDSDLDYRCDVLPRHPPILPLVRLQHRHGSGVATEANR